eukprot:jgi/Ulvmu1/3682/UM017_0098.1
MSRCQVAVISRVFHGHQYYNAAVLQRGPWQVCNAVPERPSSNQQASAPTRYMHFQPRCRHPTHAHVSTAAGALAASSVCLLITHMHADCAAPASSPAEGDLRLVPLNGTGVATAACDDVHFGGVELFRQGRWGRICNGRFGRDEDEFTVDAQVVCRQLGFPFGTVMDEEEVRGAYDSDYDYSSPTMLTWASEVVCTGKEERLLDCDFPQNFGDDYSSRYSGYYDYYGFYNENWPAPAHAEPQPAPMESAPPPSSGLRRSGRCGRTDMNRLAVVCRSFEITESDFIKR